MRAISCIVAAIALFAVNLAAPPAMAHYRGGHHGCGTGCAVASLATGVVLGAALSNERTREPGYAMPYGNNYSYAQRTPARSVDPRLAQVMAGLGQACSAGDDLSCARLARLAQARSGYGYAGSYAAAPLFSGSSAYYGNSSGYGYGGAAAGPRTTVVIQNQGGYGSGDPTRYQSSSTVPYGSTYRNGGSGYASGRNYSGNSGSYRGYDQGSGYGRGGGHWRR